MMAENILFIQLGAFGQIGLSKPLCSDETPLMNIKESVPEGCVSKKKFTSFSIRTTTYLYSSDSFF